ncbi:hypothetical protein [Bacillus sp. V5-8f]|uniref:hypothetical protein n=1 Tax=Bacillus sp. V5-8f TaxID=2053044 RepID=UPI000C78A306|nr:hypothetical protein [Bacillus sp. V5-8f]PLT35171.1 hypothetical protein CUU64_07280 [Bacillus sp. V5-8f]
MTNNQIFERVNEELSVLGFDQYKLNFITGSDVLHFVHPSGVLRILDRNLVKDLQYNTSAAIGSIVQLIDRYDMVFSLSELCVSRLKELGHPVHFKVGYFSFCKGASYNYIKKTIYLNPSRIFRRWNMYFKHSIDLSHFITILILHELGHVLQDQEQPLIKRLKQFVSGCNQSRLTNKDVEKYKQFLIQEEKDAWNRCEKYLPEAIVEPSSFSKIKSYCLNSYTTLEFAKVKKNLHALVNDLR